MDRQDLTPISSEFEPDGPAPDFLPYSAITTGTGSGDGTAIGVQFNTGSISGRDFEQAELQQLNEQQFRNGVRNKRQIQQAAQIELLQNKSAKSTINGHDATPTLVDGNFRLG